MKTSNKKTNLIFDLFFCMVFMPALIVLGPAHCLVKTTPVFFILVCGYCYLIYFVLRLLPIPNLLLSKKYGKLTLLGGSLILVNYLLTLYPLPDIDFVTESLSALQTKARDYSVNLSLWLMFSLVAAYSLTVSFVKELYGQLLIKKEIEIQRDKAKLAVFKAQISPHFMFNTLNSLYSLVLGTSQKAEDAFIKFTEILKYTYISIDHEWVALGDEIAYIQNYIDLQELRLNSHTKVRWIHKVDEEEIRIPPMILLTFVENAFKYGASTSHDCEIFISLSLNGKHLEFETCNQIMKHSTEFRTEIPVGIEDCRARLETLFPKRYSLDTKNNENNFKALLKLDLN